MARRLKLPRLRRGGPEEVEAPAGEPGGGAGEDPPTGGAGGEDASAGTRSDETSPTGPDRQQAEAESAQEQSAPESDLSPRRWRGLTPLLIGLGVLAAIGAGVAIGYAIFDEPGRQATLPAVAPTVVIDGVPEPEAAEEIGFPAFATQNTTRVGGETSTAVAAGVALASYPAVGGVGGPRMVVVAPEDSWQAALAASPLVARPLGAPILLGAPDEIPGFTAEALSGLSPTGLERADGVQVLAINGVATPEDLEVARVNATDPALLAKELDRQRGDLGGRKQPDSLLVVSSERSEYSMPAAAWAARSGDPILFADGDEVPEATIDVLERHPDSPVYVLGPRGVIGNKAVERLRKVSGRAIRIGAPDPIANAIEFARFVDGGFGWNINDPGHGFTIANTARPADAPAGAPLAAQGKPGPLLLTDSADRLPPELQAFLLDTKPGFADDPSRAVYNHVWLLGDTSAISLGVQARIDELTELERIRQGSGVPDFGAEEAEPEAEREPRRR